LIFQIRLRQVNRSPHLQIADDVHNADVVIAQLRMLGSYRSRLEGITGDSVGCGDVAAIERLVEVFYSIVNNSRPSITLSGQYLHLLPLCARLVPSVSTRDLHYDDAMLCYAMLSTESEDDPDKTVPLPKSNEQSTRGPMGGKDDKPNRTSTGILFRGRRLGSHAKCALCIHREWEHVAVSRQGG